MKKTISALLCTAVLAQCGATAFAAAIDTVKEDMDTQIITVSGSKLSNNDKVLIEVFNFDNGTVDYENGLEGIFAVNTDENGSYTVSFKLPKTSATGEKKIFARPVVGKKSEDKIDFYSSESIDTILRNWNSAIQNQDKTSMEKVINDKTALKIILNSSLADTLASELASADKTVLAEKLLKLPEATKIGDFAPDFIAPYINFAINNLSADTLAKLVSEFYDEIDTVKGTVYENIISKMSDDEKNVLFKDSANFRTKDISTADFASVIYSRAVYNKFSEITYYADVKPFIDLYNTDYFKIDFTDYDTVSNKYEVDSKVLENRHAYSDFETFKTKYEGWAAEQKEAEGESGGSSGGTSGGSSSGSGKGKGSGVSFVPTPKDEDISVVKEEIFNDLENFDWAKEHIMALYNKGAVDGTEKNTFSPSNLVTREQFVKMISALTTFDENPPSAEFSDVAKGEWYEKYINGAKASGLISGRDDGTFGVGDCIIRQDAAIMCLNAIKKERPDLLENLKIEKLPFGDAGDISSYAVYAVSALNKLGILNGDASGNFNANANATRAEAAVMINKVMTLIGEGAEK